MQQWDNLKYDGGHFTEDVCVCVMSINVDMIVINRCHDYDVFGSVAAIVFNFLL